MKASRLTIECRFFSDLNDVIRAACGARDASWTSPQFEYIQSYLQRGTARAKTMVVEKPYVDRHYLEEYGAYYFSASGTADRRRRASTHRGSARVRIRAVRAQASA